MQNTNPILSFRVPECVYLCDWEPLREEVRWQFATALGLPRALQVVELHSGETILRQAFEEVAVAPTDATAAEIRIEHLEKSLTQFPITRTPSLWRELLPYPFPHFENLPAGPQVATSDSLVKQVECARIEVARWDQQLEQQELSTLYILDGEGKLAHAVAFQTVRKKRVRMGLLKGEAFEWVQKALENPQDMQDGLPRMQAISATGDTRISTSSASTDDLLPPSADSSRPSEEASRPENP